MTRIRPWVNAIYGQLVAVRDRVRKRESQLVAVGRAVPTRPWCRRDPMRKQVQVEIARRMDC